MAFIASSSVAAGHRNSTFVLVRPAKCEAQTCGSPLYNAGEPPLPTSCAEVPTDVLMPRNTWSDKDAYDLKAKELQSMFDQNFEKYS